MPGHTKVNVEEFAPKAWHAICDLVGGALLMIGSPTYPAEYILVSPYSQSIHPSSLYTSRLPAHLPTNQPGRRRRLICQAILKSTSRNLLPKPGMRSATWFHNPSILPVFTPVGYPIRSTDQVADRMPGFGSKLPGHTKVNVEEFAPKAWHAICDLVGGADRVADWCKDFSFVQVDLSVGETPRRVQTEEVKAAAASRVKH
jgi:hypothetical protein